MPPDDLAAWIAELRRRLDAGEPEGADRDEAEGLLGEVAFFQQTQDMRTDPELWDPLRRRLAENLRALRERLG